MSSRATLQCESLVSLFPPAGNGKLFIPVEDGFKYCALLRLCVRQRRWQTVLKLKKQVRIQKRVLHKMLNSIAYECMS